MQMSLLTTWSMWVAAHEMVALPLAMGHLCGLRGAHGRAFVLCTFPEAAVMNGTLTGLC